MVRYFVFIERICSRLNRHISHIKTHEFYRNGENDRKRRLFQFLLQIWLTLACKIHSDLAAKSTIAITGCCFFATITLRSKHRQLCNCEIHFATEQYNYKYGNGTGAISTFAELRIYRYPGFLR